MCLQLDISIYRCHICIEEPFPNKLTICVMLCSQWFVKSTRTFSARSNGCFGAWNEMAFSFPSIVFLNCFPCFMRLVFGVDCGCYNRFFLDCVFLIYVRIVSLFRVLYNEVHLFQDLALSTQLSKMKRNINNEQPIFSKVSI